MGIADRYWEPITRPEARGVLGPETDLLTRHRRWLFAVARCRTPTGDVYLKRQPPMGRARSQIEWQHRLTNHLADRGVPATRALRLVESERLWYECPRAGHGRERLRRG